MAAGKRNINVLMVADNNRRFVCGPKDDLRFIATDKDGLEMVEVRIRCESFYEIYSYEVFVGRESYIKYTYNSITNEYDFPKDGED